MTLLTAGLLLASAPTAFAANNCGTWYAGELTNNTRYSILVKGDTWSNGVAERWIPPGGTAEQSGICDADYFSTQVDFRREPNGHPYSAGGPHRINSASVLCETAPDYYEQPTRCWW